MNQSLQNHLLDHCIICLRKVSRRKEKSSGKTLGGGGSCSDISPEIAPETLVNSPGFLPTFNQVWTVLQTKWKEKKNGDKGLPGEMGISLENVVENADCHSANVSFSRAPTMCQYCCGKVHLVENLMKTVRQHVREISMFFEEGRRRQDGGGVGNLEKSLREKALEENVIQATLEFVGIFPQGRGAEDDDDDGDLDYVKEEPEEGDICESTDGSEKEMEVDEEEENKNDPEFQEVEKDPLANRFPEKRKDKSGRKRWGNKRASGSRDGNKSKASNHGKFRCSCGKAFSTMKGRSEHMRTNSDLHPEYNPLKGHRQNCELCGKWVLHRDILQHYKEEDHLNGQDEWVIRCPNGKCRWMFVSTNELRKHIRATSDKQCKKIWKEKCGQVCEICGFKGTNMMVIRNHVRDKHESGKEKKWRCPISGCGKMFGVKQSVSYHLSEHRYQPPITQQNCDKCGENLKVEEMEGHLEEEHGIEEVIECKHCGMKFSGREEMVEHLYEHRSVGIHCDICGVDKFARYCDFREHYFVVHELCPKKYKCGEGTCDLWFWRKENIEEHVNKFHKRMRKVQKLMKKICALCDFECSTEDCLIKHQVRVHGEDPLKCDICGEKFDDKHVFNKHKKEHVGVVSEKEWKCEVEGCGKTFRTKRLWKHHGEVGHGGERRHVCEICGKGFTLAKSLRGHRDSVHLGLRPWVCDECGEAFTNSAVLKKHKLIHTGERPFGCEICGQRFRHENALKTHFHV